MIIAEENNEVKKQNKKDDPKSNDEENIFDHNDQTADYKKADYSHGILDYYASPKLLLQRLGFFLSEYFFEIRKFLGI